jgi:hypothetical protein
MTARIQITIGVVLALIVFPVLIVQAQSEGETAAPPTTEVDAQETGPAADGVGQGPQESEGAVASEQEGSVLEAETSTETSSSEQEPEASAVSSDAANSGEESAAAASTETASTSQDFLTLVTASSTASSTEPVEDVPAVPYEEPFVLPQAVTLHVEGTSLTADIQLENLTGMSPSLLK